MHELLNNYVAKKEKEKRELYEKKKKDLLISQGLFEKEYSTESKYSEEFPNQEWDPTINKQKYYKIIPIEVTDEEYEQIKKLSNSTDPVKENVVAIILTAIAWITFIGGFILGIICGNVTVEGYYRDYTEFSLTVALVYWAASFISGMMFIGFAEIIKLLNNINNKLHS